MLNQPKLNVIKRGDLVGWILTHCQWDRRDPILTFAAVDIFDRFLSVQVVSPEEVRYLCVAALHIAIKYYETQDYITPSLDELTKSINNGLPDPDRLHRYRARIMELRILNEFGWEIDVPTVYSFLILFIDAAKIPPDSPSIKMAYFYAKLGIWDYRLMMAFPQEMLAAAAFVAACAYTNSISMCRPISQVYTGLKRKQLLECSKRLRKLHRAGHGYKGEWETAFGGFLSNFILGMGRILQSHWKEMVILKVAWMEEEHQSLVVSLLKGCCISQLS